MTLRWDAEAVELPPEIRADAGLLFLVVAYLAVLAAVAVSTTSTQAATTLGLIGNAAWIAQQMADRLEQRDD